MKMDSVVHKCEFCHPEAQPKDLKGIDSSAHFGPQNDVKSDSSRYSTKGFTLIELMIVVIIIAALAAIVVPRMAGRTDQAKTAVAQADVSSNISMALKLYDLDNGHYPSSEQGLSALVTKPSGAPTATNWSGPYLENMPVDPWGNPYQYRCPGVHNTSGYDLFSNGKDASEGTADDIKNWQ